MDCQYECDGGFQSRVALELLSDLGLCEQCVARSRAEIADHAVQVAKNRQLQLSIRQYLFRVYEQII
jgi:hypothetical protein